MKAPVKKKGKGSFSTEKVPSMESDKGREIIKQFRGYIVRNGPYKHIPPWRRKKPREEGKFRTLLRSKDRM